MNKLYNIGVRWDLYSPAVEGNLARDLIALKNAVEKWPGTKLQVICQDSDADRMLRVLQIPRLSIPSLPGAWLLYQTQEQRLDPPEGAPYNVKKIERQLYQKSKQAKLEQVNDTGFALKEQGRDNTYDPYNRMPTTSTDWHVTDPLITLLWTR